MSTPCTYASFAITSRVSNTRKKAYLNILVIWRWKPKGHKKIIMDEKCTLIPTWQSINNIQCFARICVRRDANSSKPCQWYTLCMRIKGPYNYMATALGLCVKWPLGPLHTRHWEPVTITLRAISLVEKVGLVQVHFTLCLRDQWSKWMQDGCKVYMDSYMASNWSCFMVTWTILKNYPLEVGLTQNRETMAFRMLTMVDLLYFIMWKDHMNRNSLK